MRKKYDWEIKSLGEIAREIYHGHGIPESKLIDKGYPAVKCRDISSHFGIYFEKCISFVDESLIKRKKYFEHGDILASNISNKIETLGKSTAYLGSEKCLAGESVNVIKHNQNPKYLSYVLNSNFCKEQIKLFAKRSTAYFIYLEKLKQVKIPIPSLEEQERIVSILDKFHTICGNIEEGIPALIRDVEKQYEYYRDQIFS